MFMRENRRKNGARQPEEVEREDAGSQRSAQKLDPNQPVESNPPDWRFDAELGTPEAINRAHYHAGISSELSLTDYERHIPFVGTDAAGFLQGERSLAGEP